MTFRTCLGIACALAAISLPKFVSAQSDGQVITTDGMLGITAGMSELLVARFLGASIYADVGGGSRNCDVRKVRNRPVEVMIKRGVVVSTTTQSNQIGTRSGARVGMTEAALRALYGRQLTRRENRYEGYEYYLFASNGNGIKFLARNGVVESITSGRRTSIELAEGCV